MQEETQQNNKDEFSLVPLTAQQFEVSAVGKATTDLPFFYLTKQKDRLTRAVMYESVDAEGRPMRWMATPNASIGTPAIDAHEAWTRLVKPTWEAYRTPDNRLPNILPLGGMRQCLRVVGWGEGGWEARRLLKALNQIGATWCNADLWIPTNTTNQDGKPTFRLIKGAFSRLTIYAIGDKHLTDEELKEGKFSFDFNLEDTLYIQFHPLEVAIQESQPQRYLDNEYMFSVGAAERRWYELMHAKIFGVARNNGEYCEVLYSWYVKHHHTLNRLTERRRVVQQIKTVVRDHIASKFIERVEFRVIREPGKPIDYVIRFFPGQAAKESITRVLASINSRRTPPGGIPRSARRNRQKELHRSAKTEKPIYVSDGQSPDLLLVEPPLSESNASTTEILTDSNLLSPSTLSEEDAKLVAELSARGLVPSAVRELLASLSPEIRSRVPDVIDYWDSQRRASKDVGQGLLYKWIKNGELPANFETRQQRAERQAAEEQRRKLDAISTLMKSRYEDNCRKAIDRFIAEGLPAGEFDRRVAEYAQRTASQHGFWSERPEMAERLARNAVRGQIGGEVSLPTYEEFERQELPRVLTELELDPKEFGIERPEQQSATASPS